MKKLIVVMIIMMSMLMLSCSPGDHYNDESDIYSINGEVESVRSKIFGFAYVDGTLHNTDLNAFIFELLELKDNKRMSQTLYHGDEQIIHKIEFDYNYKGQLESVNWQDASEEVKNEITYVYYKSGRIKQVSQYTDGTLVDSGAYEDADVAEADQTSDAEYEYNDYGDTISVKYMTEGEVVSLTEYLYEYDDQDNWVKKTTIVDEVTTNIIERTITYK